MQSHCDKEGKLRRVLQVEQDETSGFSAHTLCFTVKQKMWHLAKQQRSAAVMDNINKVCMSREPLSTGRFTQRNTRAIDCSYKATRLAAWEPLLIWEPLLKHWWQPGCSLPATPPATYFPVLSWHTKGGCFTTLTCIITASRCAASNALSTSLKQTLQFLSYPQMWQWEDSRSSFSIRCIFSPP